MILSAYFQSLLLLNCILHKIFIPLLFLSQISFSVVFTISGNQTSSISDSGIQNQLYNYGDYNYRTQHKNIHTSPEHFTDQWAVHVEGGLERAHDIASRHGFINVGEILPDHYHFVHYSLPKRSIKHSHEFHHRLSLEPEVRWHAQQTIKKRVKRDFLETGNSNKGLSSSQPSNSRRRPRLITTPFTFRDPRWPAMWYLNRGSGLDMNVQEAWELGITGKGIVVTILDDGLEKDHPDILRNYDPMASYDVNNLDMDPMPTYDLTDSNRHGTRCAGEVAAEANNTICAVGIAFEAGVGGVRMLDGDVTDAVEARSLSHNPQHIDIYSASWGPDDDGKTVDGPGELATRAFIEGVTKGRGGKGSIFVWASGNGGRDHDNCNCDGYTNSIWTLSISSATENGLVPWYSEACSSTLATTYSSGGTGEKQIVTIDLHHSCTSSHTGTSASAPLAAGICALALQANTNLTWRDMQHIVVRTARPQNLVASDWATNGVGRNVSHSFGYGLMDAGAMVKLARKWKTVPEQKKCEVRARDTDKTIPAKGKSTFEIEVTNCPGVKFLEHVQAKVTLTSAKRGDLLIVLISPLGTRSIVLANRRHDINRSGFIDWPFMTVHSWGETPLGKWSLEIHNEGRYAGRTILKRWSLILYGTRENVNAAVSINDAFEKSPIQFPFILRRPTADGYRSGIGSEETNLGSTKIQTTTTIASKLNRTSSENPTLIRKPARQRLFKFKPMSKRPKASFNYTTMTPLTTSLFPDISPSVPSPTVFFSSATPPVSKDNEKTTISSQNSQNESTEGKLQKWAVVLHGISENPNGPIQVTPQMPGLIESEHEGMKSMHEPDAAVLEFDGSENKVVMEPSNVHNPSLASSHPEVADMTSVTSGGTPCYRNSASKACLGCPAGLYLFQENCLTMCPVSYYGKFHNTINRKGVLIKSASGSCFPCHYSCQTCVGEGSEACSSCFADSSLIMTNYENGTSSAICYPTHILETIEQNSFWYRVLLITIIVNVFALVIIVGYIVYRKKQGNAVTSIWPEKRGAYRVVPREDHQHDADDVLDVDIRYEPPIGHSSSKTLQ